ncbi:MAG: phospho-N-acetylmuramoyl-pentapeptide-transferase [Bacteroidetes bacterium]|nr:phospho-N-acetylmuramoyl-pentapeptide-transferase [Bacteroidota bacterium]
MFYYLFEYLDKHFDFPGAGLFQFLSFRASLALIVSLLISMVLGKRIIAFLQLKQVGEIIRDLGLHGQMSKQGTPTMGGLIILACILIPTLLFARLHNVYILILIISTIWLGLIGFLDDYIKVFKKNKEGLAGKFKIVGQVGIGLIVGSMLYFHPDVTIRRQIVGTDVAIAAEPADISERTAKFVDAKAPITTIPFVKNHEFNYAKPLSFLGDGYEKWAWLIFIPVVIFIITAVSNGANMTDGLDGLAAGTTGIIGFVLAIFAYVSGNLIFADYLNIMYIPDSGEIVVYMSAFVGACVGFLWYNSFPAQIFMGDTGSLAIGGIVAVVAIALRKELLIPILCGIYLVENLSVMLQVSYFKFTKKKYGEGRRIFKMAPLHHHYQKLGFHESKIVARFWIVGVALAVLTMVTLKMR